LWTKGPPLNTVGELMRSGKESSSCSTNDTCRVTLNKNPVITYDRDKDDEILTTKKGAYW